MVPNRLAPHNGRMNVTHLRNATIVLELKTPEGPAVVLVDPMLSAPGQLPPLKYFTRERRRNPLVPLPPVADEVLGRVTHALITHCQRGHFDHLDSAGLRWLRERQLPVLCTPHDADHLSKRGLRTVVLESTLLGGRLTLVPCVHGEGLVGRFMEHGTGYFLEFPGEPSLYLAGDTVLTPQVRAFVEQRQPEVMVLPAGGARLDLGGHIIMDEDEVLELARSASGVVIANHLEALDHCGGSRASLRSKADAAGLGERIRIPLDGQTLAFAA